MVSKEIGFKIHGQNGFFFGEKSNQLLYIISK